MAQVTRKGYNFSSTVNADSTEIEKVVAKHDATIEHVHTRFYPGQQLDLQLKLQVVAQDGTKKEIVDPVGERSYVAGDDDKFNWDISVPVEKGDTIRVVAQNVETQYDYDYVANMEVDRLNGLERITSKLGDLF